MSTTDGDEEVAQNICDFVNLSLALDAETVFHVISPKLFSHYSLFDLAMHKAKQAVDFGAIETLIEDAEAFLQDLKQLVEGCLEARGPHQSVAMKGVHIPDNVAQGVGIQSGEWTLKPLIQIEYKNDILSPEFLFPSDNVVSATESVVQEASEEAKSKKGDSHLCLKCGLSLTSCHGKRHEKKCQGMRVRHPQYKKVDGEFVCTVPDCDIGHSFTSRYGLRKHFHSEHTAEEEKFFVCEYCPEKFSFNTAKNKHVKLKHLKNHTCQTCGKAFGAKHKLEQHRLTHTGQKPFGCEKCDYRATKRYNLELHIRRHHGEVVKKNFKCDICHMELSTMARIRRHKEKVHHKRIMYNVEKSVKAERKDPVPSSIDLNQITFDPMTVDDSQFSLETDIL